MKRLKINRRQLKEEIRATVNRLKDNLLEERNNARKQDMIHPCCDKIDCELCNKNKCSECTQRCC